MSIKKNELLEIQIKVEGVKYSYIGLGQYEDSQDGILVIKCKTKCSDYSNN